MHRSLKHLLGWCAMTFQNVLIRPKRFDFQVRSTGHCERYGMWCFHIVVWDLLLIKAVF
uniref:Uncharacterized protein n=1 Tax=Anguilla anguilla TaxID=7936 RepID=A0A0E9WSW1_ANGAN